MKALKDLVPLLVGVKHPSALLNMRRSRWKGEQPSSDGEAVLLAERSYSAEDSDGAL